MDLWDIQKSVARDQKAMQKGVARDQRNMQRSIAKDLRLSISKEGRVRIPAKRRHDVEDKYHDKCAVCKQKPCKLQIHHKNMKNNDNRLINLELLCPNHHIQRHSKAFRRRTTTFDIMRGTQTRTRLVKKKPKIPKRSKPKRKPAYSFKAPKLDFKFTFL